VDGVNASIAKQATTFDLRANDGSLDGSELATRIGMPDGNVCTESRLRAHAACLAIFGNAARSRHICARGISP